MGAGRGRSEELTGAALAGRSALGPASAERLRCSDGDRKAGSPLGSGVPRVRLGLGDGQHGRTRRSGSRSAHGAGVFRRGRGVAGDVGRAGQAVVVGGRARCGGPGVRATGEGLDGASEARQHCEQFVSATASTGGASHPDASHGERRAGYVVSIYTQIALSATDRLVLPVMADDSSRRAIQNAFSLVYGLKLPSDIYQAYAFATRLRQAGRALPKAHLIAKNRITQYMGDASAYQAVLRSIDADVSKLINTNPEIFTFDDIDQGVVSIRDFQTTGVVAFAKGTPLYALKSGKRDVLGHRVTVHENYRVDMVAAMESLVAKL